MADNSTYLPTIPSGHIEGSRWISNTRDADKPVPTELASEIAKKMSASRFYAANTLPPTPVAGLGFVLIPALNLCKFGSDNKVSQIQDITSGSTFLQSDTGKQPTIHIADNGVEFLRFAGDSMECNHIGNPNVVNANKTDTTFFFVAKTDAQVEPTFVWGSGSRQITAYLPDVTGGLEVRHTTGTNKVVYTRPSSADPFVPKLTSYYFVRDGDNMQVWQDGVRMANVTTTSVAIPDGGNVTLTVGNDSLNMDLYGLAFFPRALTPIERQKMFIFSKSHFGV